MTISLKNPQWRATLDKELELCSAKTIPLCNATKELQNLSRETKRHNLSQLSQLSFEELGGKKKLIYFSVCLCVLILIQLIYMNKKELENKGKSVQNSPN